MRPQATFHPMLTFVLKSVLDIAVAFIVAVYLISPMISQSMDSVVDIIHTAMP